MNERQKAEEREAIQTYRTNNAGWTVQTVVNEKGRTVYQLYDAQGNYVASNLSEDALWKRAYKRSILPE